MAQHDYNIGDQNGFDFLLDLNNALSAIATNNAGSSEPNTTFAHMLWFDTNNDLMKVRNEANSEWLILAKKDGSVWTPYHLVNATLSGMTTTTRLRTTAGNNATPTGTDHPYQIGSDAGLNVRFDDNAIGAFDNGVGSRLTLNRYGGGVAIGPISANSPEKLRVVEEVNNSMVAQFINSAGDSGDIHGKGYIGFGVSNSFEETGCYIGWDQESTSGYQQALTFGTRPDIEEFPTERMRITSGGDVQITKSLSVKGATLETTGTAPLYACRAWVNFNGTGTVAIRASGNVSSITDNGVGDYFVNFTTNMEDANYAATANWTDGSLGTDSQDGPAKPATYGVGSVRILLTTGGGSAQDGSIVSVAIFR